jgi:hypothetical protein
MKTHLLLLLCLSLWFPLTVRAADTNPPPRLTVELRDGSRVIGESAEKNFKFHSALLGDIKLNVIRVRSVECVATNSAKLVTASGDTLTVSFADSALILKTGFGKVELAAGSIRKLTVAATGGTAGHRAGLVALWSGDGNANDSAGENHGRLFGNVKFAQGLAGQAFDLNPAVGIGEEMRFSGFQAAPRFNRGNGFVLVPAGPALNVGTGDGLTIEGWIRLATTSRAMAIIEYERNLGTSDGTDVGVDLFVSQPTAGVPQPGALMVSLVDTEQASHTFATPPGAVTAGVWQHVALTYDKSSGAAVIYVNGAAAAQANVGSFTPQTGFANLILGARTTFGSVTNPNDAFSGRMANMAIYNRALTAAEIHEDFTAGKAD